MSHPKRVEPFIAWSKLMVAGATIDREWTKGSKTSTRGSSSRRTSSKKRKKRKRKRRKRAQE